MYDADPDAKQVVDVAKGLEGLRRQDGIHAAAVVITKEPLTEYLPIQRKPEAGQDPERRADRHAVRDARRRGARPAEDGLPRPAQPRRHQRHRRAHRASARATDLDIDTVPLDDADDVRAAAAGATRSACSSSRAAPMRALLRSLAPDAASTTSPRSSRCTGRARWRRTCTTTTPTARTAASRSSTSTPTLEELLGDTYGLMIYQE